MVSPPFIDIAFVINTRYMHPANNIIIGNDLLALSEREGEFALLFFQAKLIFDNLQAAIEAYDFCVGEAYLWDISPSNQEAYLLQAKVTANYVRYF